MLFQDVRALPLLLIKDRTEDRPGNIEKSSITPIYVSKARMARNPGFCCIFHISVRIFALSRYQVSVLFEAIWEIV